MRTQLQVPVRSAEGERGGGAGVSLAIITRESAFKGTSLGSAPCGGRLGTEEEQSEDWAVGLDV